MRGAFQLGRSFFAIILICISCNGWAYGGLMVDLWWTYDGLKYGLTDRTQHSENGK